MLRSNKKKNANHQYDTLISSQTEIKGDVQFSGGVHIDGHIKGMVFANDSNDAVVRISDHGIVEGEIHAPYIIINGKVIGDIYSSEHIELAANASVIGTVHYNFIEMVMGAQVNGNLIHHDSSEEVKQLGYGGEVLESQE